MAKTLSPRHLDINIWVLGHLIITILFSYDGMLSVYNLSEFSNRGAYLHKLSEIIGNAMKLNEDLWCTKLMMDLYVHLYSWSSV